MRQLRRLKVLMDYDLLAKDGDIGKLKGIFFDDRDWLVRYFVVRTGNWLIGREVLLTPTVINAISEPNQEIEVELSRQQIEESPPADTKKTVSRHYEEEYFKYYNLEPYWHLDPSHGISPPVPTPEAYEPPQKPDRPHLRSSAEVCGYRIHAADDEFGQVETFILDDQEWNVRYLEIDTDTWHWFPGKKVLIAPTWIQQIDWSKGEVRVNLPKKMIKSAPEYDPEKIISPEYELELYSHYGKA